jgi:hypothetical protein
MEPTRSREYCPLIITCCVVAYRFLLCFLRFSFCSCPQLDRDETQPLEPIILHPKRTKIIVKGLDKNCDSIELLRLLSREDAGAGNSRFIGKSFSAYTHVCCALHVALTLSVNFETRIVRIFVPTDAQDKVKVRSNLHRGVKTVCVALRV